MESNYSTKYSGEQVDAAIEYFLNHSQITDNSSYEYTNTIYCKSSAFPAKPFKDSELPVTMPSFPFTGTDGNLWYDVPNTSTKDWYQCILKINYKSNLVITQSTVLDMQGETGDKGEAGNDGTNGTNGEDGKNGSNGNFIEFRYKRASQYAITLGAEQKSDRYPEGWNTDWSEADVEDYETLLTNICVNFDKYLISFSSDVSLSESSYKYFTELESSATFTRINKKFHELHGDTLTANDTQEALIVEVFKAFKALYDTCNKGETDLLTCNTEYHRIYAEHIDENHFWVLFMIYATIDGNDNTLIGEWSAPQRMQGVDGKAGPAGSNGIDGIAGVNIGIAFTLGTEEAIRPDAANPTTSPYNNNYDALFAAGTNWYKASPSISTDYPYIWFTQCRYLVTTDSNGNDIYTFEDTWSTPARYTGLNGVTTKETVYVRNPIIYPMGLYTAGVSYTNDGIRTPYVYYEDENGGNYYYLSGQGSWVGSTTSTPANNSDWWTKLEGFEALYTKIGIIANGLIGSAVFNGDYMFSQQGVDQEGNTSTHYERFLQDYSTGDTLTNPYDDKASFKPNFCINFKTGEQWSTSMDTAISGAKSEVIQTATNISLSVQDTIEGNLKASGVNITSTGVEVTGKFSGTSSGSFNGDVSANSFTIIGDDGTPVVIFDTYKESMGTPSGGTAPDEGTPVLLINYGGNQYLMSMLKLVTGSSTGQYKQTQPTIKDLYTTTSISNKMGTQGTANYHCITKAPYLTLVDNNGNTTNTTVAAKLYDLNDNEVSWNKYLNKYYSGTLVTEYPSKTDLGSGIWAFKVTGSLATVSGIYSGIPTTKYLAVTQYCTPLSGSGGNVYVGVTSSLYTQIKLIAGTLSTVSNTNVVVGYNVKWNGSNLSQDTTSTKFLSVTGYSITATQMTLTGASTTSTFFAVTSSTASEIDDISIENCADIVGPKLNTGTNLAS